MVKKAGTKRKKAERAKVQLKGPSKQKTPLSTNKKKSFKLPKGRNELDTWINAKSLSVPSQLSHEDASVPSTSKNLPLKHYLIKLKHYSRSTRLEGLRGIKEILSSYPESTPDSLSSLIYKVSPLLSDTEEDVGKESGKLIQMIVSFVERESLAPFHPVLSAHLCVALSHIDQGVQHTGLNTLDAFIICIPDFISSSYKEILPSLLNQISMGKEGIRKLSNKVNSGKVTTLQWRTEVLERLRALFQALVIKETSSEKIQNSKFFDDDNPFSAGGLESLGHPNEDSIPMDFLDSESIRVVKNLSEESFSLTTFSHNLLPLLFETWKEASLSTVKRKQSESTATLGLLHPSNVEVYSVVVDILLLITQMMRQETNTCRNEEFRGLMKKKISSHILPGFPYHFSSSVKNKKLEESSACINLKFSSTYLEVANPYNPDVIERILDYSLSISESRGKDCDDIYHHLLKLLSSIIFIEGQFPSLITRLDQLLNESLKLRPKNSMLTELLSDLSSYDSCRAKSKTLKDWIRGLPQHLVYSSSTSREVIVSTIHKLQKQNNSLLLQAFSMDMDLVTDKLKESSRNSSVNLKTTLELLIILSYRLQKRYPKLKALVEGLNDDYISCFHTNLINKNVIPVCS